MRRGFCPDALRVHRGLVAVYHAVVKGVLEKSPTAWRAEANPMIGFILGKEQLRPAVARPSILAEGHVFRAHGSFTRRGQPRFWRVRFPRPRIAKPKLR